MEALWDPGVAERANRARVLEEDLGGYLGQPEMRALVSAALDLGWTLHAYEANIGAGPYAENWGGQEAINWREDQQARNLGAVVNGLQRSARVLCWCGGGHLCKKPYETTFGENEPSVWIPMGSLVEGYCGVEPFAIDQLLSVAWGDYERAWLDAYADDLRAYGGTAGFGAGPPRGDRVPPARSGRGRIRPLARQRDDGRAVNHKNGVWPATCGPDPEDVRT